jgi:hypothetical protein
MTHNKWLNYIHIRERVHGDGVPGDTAREERSKNDEEEEERGWV